MFVFLIKYLAYSSGINCTECEATYDGVGTLSLIAQFIHSHKFNSWDAAGGFVVCLDNRRTQGRV